MQEEIYNSSNNIDNSKNYFSPNIKFLFKLNKDLNRKNIQDFINSTGIPRGTVGKWFSSESIPAKPNMNRLLIYFNGELGLDLTASHLIKKRLIDKEIKKIREQSVLYLTTTERQLIQRFRILSPKAREHLLKLIVELSERVLL